MKYRTYFRTLRLIDANIDRLSEGLRVLEDISRFVLGRPPVTEALKRMRHELIPVDPLITLQLLSARDAEGDIGRQFRFEGTQKGNLIELVTANARRSQQALRSLEEMSKLPEIPTEISEHNYEKARFSLYEIEKELTLLLSRQDKRERIAGVYIIIDPPSLAKRDIIEFARGVIGVGVSAIQLRDKLLNKSALLDIAAILATVCREAGVLFIMNDHVDIAIAVDADGVHLGEDDLPIAIAREMMHPDKLIGHTVRTVEQALRAEFEGADYLGVGSVYPSPTKPGAPLIGLEGLEGIAKAVSIPIVAIGGINVNNALEVIEHGADGIAVVSAVLAEKDIASATRDLVEIIKGKGA